MTLYEIEETLRRVVKPERIGGRGDIVDYFLADGAKDVLVELLHRLERERLSDIDKAASR